MRLPFRRTSVFPTVDEELTARWIESTVSDSFRPDDERIARVRTTVLAEHHLAAARAAYLSGATDAGATDAGATAGRSRRLGARGLGATFGRRAGILATALLGVLAVSGVAAAQSGPGQPFYDVRLAAESLTLPPDGTSDGVRARLRLLDERLAEVRTAAKHGDEKAAAAALGAYRSSLAQLFPSGGPRAVDLGRIAVPGVDLPAVDGNLSDDSAVLRDLQPGLPSSDASTATGVIDTVGRIRAAIADEVARDQAAHDNAGSGNGLGPRADGSGAASGSTAGPTPTPSPSHRPERKRHAPRPTPIATPTLAPAP